MYNSLFIKHIIYTTFYTLVGCRVNLYSFVDFFMSEMFFFEILHTVQFNLFYFIACQSVYLVLVQMKVRKVII